MSKEVFINGKSFKIPESLISASYAGACAAHQVIVHEELFGKDKVDFHEHFRGNYEAVKDTCDSTVKELPPKLSLREIVSSSPANRDFGGF